MRISNYLTIDEYINDSFRVLLLIGDIKQQRSNKMDLSRIILLDYYLKYPNTMIPVGINELTFRENYDEFFSFFHWKPDWNKYVKYISFLLSKNLIKSNIIDSAHVYVTTDVGRELIVSISNAYKEKMLSIIDYLSLNVINLSNKNIEEDIVSKSNLFKKYSALQGAIRL